MSETNIIGLDEMGWASREAAGARLADKRFRRVVAECLAAKFDQSDVSFSQSCGSALRQAAGRLLRNENTTPDDLMAGHGQATLERCMGEPLIVVAQDTTTYSYSTHTATSGLGPINDSDKALGIHQHSALAMTEAGFPLGVVFAKFWTRPAAGVSRHNRRNVPTEEKESFKWIEAADRVEALLAPYIAGGGRVVLAGDRESDVFDLLAKPRRPQMEILIRAAHPRTVVVQSSKRTCSLLEATEDAASLGRYNVEVPAKQGQAARVALMDLRSAFVLVQPPRNGIGHAAEAAPAWVVTAREVVTAGAQHQPLDWTLTTTLDACGKQAARRVVDLYTCRWQIERLHFTLKSGCKAERLQMDDARTLGNTLALYIVVAWRLLYITHLARVAPETPAGEIIDESERAVLEQHTGKTMATVAQVVVAIAKLVGYEPYANGPPPGVKTIWLGMRKLESMALGWRLAMNFNRVNNYQ